MIGDNICHPFQSLISYPIKVCRQAFIQVEPLDFMLGLVGPRHETAWTIDRQRRTSTRMMAGRFGKQSGIMLESRQKIGLQVNLELADRRSRINVVG